MADEKKEYTLENAPLELLLEKREVAKQRRNHLAVAQFNDALKRRFDYTDPVPEADKPLAEREGGAISAALDVAPDIAKSVQSGAIRGTSAMADLPSDLADLTTSGVAAATKFATGNEMSSQAKDIMRAVMGMNPIQLTFLRNQLFGDKSAKQTAESVAPEAYNYEPETFTGKVAQTATEFATGGGLRRPVAQVLAPALAVETIKGSNLPENVKLPAEIAAMILTPSVYKRAFSPAGGTITGNTKKAIELLNKEGVFPTTGQKTGVKSIAMMEEGAEAGAAMQQQAFANFTKAALKRVGIDKLDNIQSDLQNVYRRIGSDLDITIGAVKPQATLKQSADLARIMQAYKGQAAELLRSPIFEQTFKAFGRSYQTKRPISTEEIRFIHQTLNAMTRQGDTAGQAAREMMPIVKEAIFNALPKDAQKRWVKANKEYRDFLTLERAFSRSDMLANGMLTPNALAAGAKNVFGKRAFLFGKDELSELAQAGQVALKPLSTSNTTERLLAQGPSAAVGGATAMAVDALSGNPSGGALYPISLAAAAAVPKMRNAAASSEAGQAFLANQLIGELDKSQLNRSLMQYLASGGLQ